jgi:hypothetical protein
LLSAYKNGKIVVRGRQNSEKDAMISDTGDIINLVDVDILFVQETGETDDEGRPEMSEIPFLQRRDSNLYISANLNTLQGASGTLNGLFFHEFPYNGNPDEINSLTRCIPSLTELLARSC